MTMRFGEKENGKVQKYVNPHVPVYKNECVSITIWRVMREETNSQSTSHSWSCRFSLCQDAQLQKIVESIGGDVFKQPCFVYSPFGREWRKFCNVRRGDVFAQQIYNRLEDAIEFNYKTPKSVFETLLYKIIDTIEKATEIYSSHPQEYWDENVFV